MTILCKIGKTFELVWGWTESCQFVSRHWGDSIYNSRIVFSLGKLHLLKYEFSGFNPYSGK